VQFTAKPFDLTVEKENHKLVFKLILTALQRAARCSHGRGVNTRELTM
jgi:hypothetical protein